MKIYKAKAIIVIAILVALPAFIGCGGSSSSPSLDAYQTCVKQVMEEGEKKNKGKIPPKLGKQLAEAACKIIKLECGKNPDGAVCKALTEKYSD